MSITGILADRPPFVRFEYVECGIDAEASQRTGRQIPLVKPHALIMQHGDKHSETVKLADEWLEQIRQRAIQGTYDPTWVARFEMQYAEWQKGNDLPRDGMPIKTWHAVNREQALRLVAMGIQTVEDLAAMPDASLGNIGLDGRYLRDLAKNHIASGLSGIDAKKLADLAQENREQAETIKALSDRLAAIEKKDKKGN